MCVLINAYNTCFRVHIPYHTIASVHRTVNSRINYRGNFVISVINGHRAKSSADIQQSNMHAPFGEKLGIIATSKTDDVIPLDSLICPIRGT